MYLSNESLLVIVLVGLWQASWPATSCAGRIGLIGDLIIGVIGAFIGDWLLPQLGLHLGVGIISPSSTATIGAVLLLLSFGWCAAPLCGGFARLGPAALV